MIQGKHIINLALSILIFWSGTGYAQETMQFKDPDQAYKAGLELFEKEKYGVAQKHFRNAIELYGDRQPEFKANARYYEALCAMELFNEDAEYLISTFIAEYPENSKVNMARFHMGRFQYRQKKYRQAIDWFHRIDKRQLDQEELSEYYFKLGYSYFMKGDYDEAGSAFYEIIEVNTKYTAPALYYYSHIAYEDKNYETALQGFQRLSNNETFAPVVPYYITQIYYLQDKYDEVINYAPDLLESASAKRAPEIAKIIGDSYYKKQEFGKALEYLQRHASEAKNISREDNYQLGYCYYRAEQFDSAAVAFEKATGEDDALAQNAYFHLADCYIELDQKKKARFAFEFASKLNFDPGIKEEALFNYALLTYELFHSPFNEAIDAFHDFIELYPRSSRIDDAYNFLVMAYMYTSNYKEALQSLEKISEMDHSMKEAYQKVAYYRGLELYNNLHYEQAIETFNKSLQYPGYNKAIYAQANYWKAEAYYQLGNFEKAVEGYDNFLLTTGAFALDEYELAHYNMGYAYFKLKDYPNAIKWFRKYTGFTDDENTRTVADAYNRIGDSYFISRSYWTAIEYYDQAVEIGLLDKDYALFQRGFALGLLNRPEKKINTMQQLVREHPASAYVDDALFEMAKSNLDQQNADQALQLYQRIVDEFPASSYVKKSLVQLGLISYNKDNNDDALKYYKRVVAEYPGTPEAKNALTGIKNIYVDMNEVDTYFAYANSLGEFADISISEQDSLTYISAEKLYMSGDCERSVIQLNNYLTEFKDGSFVLNAHFYLAECYSRMGQNGKALEAYNYVIGKPKNTFTEQALLQAAFINYNQENYQQALEHFTRLEKIAELNSHLLESRVGQMRCNYRLENYRNTIQTADKLLHTEKISDELIREARYKKGKSLVKTGNDDLAIDEFRIISEDVNSREGAEAKYWIAEIYFKDKKYDIAEHEIFDFASQNTSQEYWLAKAFILLSDVYIAKDDLFQAKHTLKSIIDNYNPEARDDIVRIAKEKYNQMLDDEEKSNIEEEKSEEILLELDGNTTDN
ncbi:MAG: tetratricopeptide repeat protein [Bacteroidales bacterium]|jgi:TolA-binding protein|nr:tetratricopeptide repeat protein [Bacteroidales bacterium]